MTKEELEEILDKELEKLIKKYPKLKNICYKIQYEVDDSNSKKPINKILFAIDDKEAIKRAAFEIDVIMDKYHLWGKVVTYNLFNPKDNRIRTVIIPVYDIPKPYEMLMH